MTPSVTPARSPDPVLTLTGQNLTRNIQNRRTPLESTPVPTALPPDRDFVPGDMLISWILKEGDIPRRDDSFSAYLWPEPRDLQGAFAHWQKEGSGPYPASMPGWLAAAADELRNAFVLGGDMPEGDITRGAGLERTYRIDGAAPTTVTGPDFAPVTFTPASLSVSWIAGDRDPRQRFRMAIHPDRKTRSLHARHWAGIHGGGYHSDTPEWVVAAAEQCRTDLTAILQAQRGA